MLRFQKNPRRGRRAAFSLAELVISIGILILMMALAGQVFTITIKSTGQATALTEVTQQLRVFEETLREDLRNVQSGQSVMLIQGNPVNAYWTQLGKEADDNANPSDGYGHLRDLEREKLKADGTPDVVNGYEKMVEPRADILMFFTARKATSFVDPSITSRVQQVVYGHAELGEYQPKDTEPSGYEMVPDPLDSTQSVFPIDATTLYPTLSGTSKFPANQWHLARRSVLLIPTTAPLSVNALSWDTIWLQGSANGLGSMKLVEGQTDVVSDFRYDDLVVRPADLKNNSFSEPPWFLPSVFGNTESVAKDQWHKPYARGRLDPSPPMMMANRMGAYFLPNCASFKVEWSLDPRSTFVAGRLDRTNEVFWFDPGQYAGTPNDDSDDDPLYALRARIQELNDSGACTNATNPKYQLCLDLSSLLCEQVSHGDDWYPYSLADRFVGRTCNAIDKLPSHPTEGKWPQLAPGDERPNTATFTALKPGSIAPLVPDDIWPSALRITVDLYDRESRLERPIRHVMVIPIGE